MDIFSIHNLSNFVVFKVICSQRFNLKLSSAFKSFELLIYDELRAKISTFSLYKCFTETVLTELNAHLKPYS